MRQGDVYWCDFPPPDKTRPALILTRSENIARLNKVTVAPITTTIRNLQSEVRLDPFTDNVFEVSVVSLDNIDSVYREQFPTATRITHLSPQRLTEVYKALEFALDLSALRGRPPAAADSDAT